MCPKWLGERPFNLLSLFLARVNKKSSLPNCDVHRERSQDISLPTECLICKLKKIILPAEFYYKNWLVILFTRLRDSYTCNFSHLTCRYLDNSLIHRIHHCHHSNLNVKNIIYIYIYIYLAKAKGKVPVNK